MLRIKDVSKMVKQILEDVPVARSDDDHLYALVCEKICPSVSGLSFGTVILKRKQMGLPAFESVRRARQKLQASYPELAGTSDTEAMREVLEDEYKAYATGVV